MSYNIGVDRPDKGPSDEDDAGATTMYLLDWWTWEYFWHPNPRLWDLDYMQTCATRALDNRN